jgi:Tfp pilus assembly protein PilF
MMANLARPSDAGAGGRPAVEALEEERDFCLRSLRDLEAERAAGDLDDVDYATLRDSYVARAAVALRSLDEADTGVVAAGAGDAGPTVEGSTGAAPPPRPAAVSAGGPWRKRILVAVGVAVVAAAGAWAVVASSATRLPGQEVTGQATGSVAVAQSLQAAQQAVDRGDAVTALKDYQKVLNGDPNQPQALTGEGWLLAQTQQPALLQQGLQMLTAAERAAPTYAPAHVYRGIALLSEADYSGAIPELRWYLAHDPDPQLAPRVRAALQQAEASAAATGSTAKKG